MRQKILLAATSTSSLYCLANFFIFLSIYLCLKGVIRPEKQWKHIFPDNQVQLVYMIRSLCSIAFLIFWQFSLNNIHLMKIPMVYEILLCTLMIIEKIKKDNYMVHWHLQGFYERFQHACQLRLKLNYRYPYGVYNTYICSVVSFRYWNTNDVQPTLSPVMKCTIYCTCSLKTL